MSLATVYTRALLGMQAPIVRVEVHLSNGLPCFNLVGLAETSVKESRERVRSALLNSRFEFPNQRLTVNLAPADLPKQGGRYDLAIAIGILAASGQIPTHHLLHTEFLGELSLSGDLQAIPGVLPACINSQTDQHHLMMPRANLDETIELSRSNFFASDHLLHITSALSEEVLPTSPQPCQAEEIVNYQDLADVRGQHQAKRALEVAAAGRHHLLLVGPPGAGKTLLASCLPGLLPPLNGQQKLEKAIIRSILATAETGSYSERPFRRPHHTCSGIALVGGGSIPKPGEITLAHHGVLFLDELPEYKRIVLDVLREPLESHQVTISRVNRTITYPANFQLVAAMNPCPCGYAGESSRNCRCTPEQIRRYQGQVSGPLLDRIDLQLQVPSQPLHVLQSQVDSPNSIDPNISEQPQNNSSATIRHRIIQAHQQQLSRQGCNNAELNPQQRDDVCQLSPADQPWLLQTCEKLQLSSRGYHRLLQVARTLADLDLSDDIQRPHLLEALSFRQPLTGRA